MEPLTYCTILVILFLCGVGLGIRDSRKKYAAEEKLQAEMFEFRAIGDQFQYLGIWMTVVSSGHTLRPQLYCEYINGRGEIEGKTFKYSNLDLLKSQNPV